MDSALRENQILGVMLICYENDRPLQGTLATLDWRLNGVFSKLIKNQVLTGKSGETLYIPVLWNQKTLHFIVLGGGFLEIESQRKMKSRELLDHGLKKMNELQFNRIGVSKNDWEIPEDHPGVREGKLCILN